MMFRQLLLVSTIPVLKGDRPVANSDLHGVQIGTVAYAFSNRTPPSKRRSIFGVDIVTPKAVRQVNISSMSSTQIQQMLSFLMVSLLNPFLPTLPKTIPSAPVKEINVQAKTNGKSICHYFGQSNLL